jgi:SAM-dependent methyltransferase
MDESGKMLYDPQSSADRDRRKPPSSRHGIMSRTQVDYDQLAPTYDRRFAASEREGTASALHALTIDLGVERLLEVGCGTGHWLSGLVPVAGQAHGLDLSAGMLSRAREHDGRLYLARGRAGSPPYAEDSFDLVLCVNAIHHFQDPAGFIRQAYRLLRPGAVLAVIGSDPHSRQDRWYIYDYFEGTWDTDLVRFPSWGTILDWAVRAGFRRVAWHPVDQIHDTKFGTAVLDDPFLKKEACSQLALLSDEAYQAGLQRIRTALAQAEAAGNTPVFQSDLTIAMLTAQKDLGAAPMAYARTEDVRSDGPR